MSARVYVVQVRPGLVKFGMSSDWKRRMVEYARQEGAVVPDAWLVSPRMDFTAFAVETKAVDAAARIWPRAMGREWFATDDFAAASALLKATYAQSEAPDSDWKQSPAA